MNLFCPSIGCDNLAMWGAPHIGYWCRPCWERMQDLLYQKVGESGLAALTPAQRTVYDEGRRQRKAVLQP